MSRDELNIEIDRIGDYDFNDEAAYSQDDTLSCHCDECTMGDE